MSHFTVLVPAQNEDELFAKLLPYYEYGCDSEMDELVTPYLTFKNVEEECTEDWLNKTTPVVVMPDGSLVSKHDSRWEIIQEDPTDLFSLSRANIPEEYEQKQVKHCELYPNFDEYMKEYHGYSQWADLGYGYWHNPNKKWDWYQVGGRWEGLLLLRNGETSNEALNQEVNWFGMIEEESNIAAKRWDSFEQLLKQANAQVTVSEFFSDQISDEHRKLIWNAIRNTSEEPVSDTIIDAMFFEPKGKTRSEHIANSSAGSLTYAFIDLEGKWHSQGEMGWFGFSHDEVGLSYDKEYLAFIQSLSPEQKLYVVDCHI